MLKHGFKPNYWYWIDHGDIAPDIHTTQWRFDDLLRKAEEMVYDTAMQEYGYVDDQNDYASLRDEEINDR